MLIMLHMKTAIVFATKAKAKAHVAVGESDHIADRDSDDIAPGDSDHNADEDPIDSYHEMCRYRRTSKNYKLEFSWNS